MKEKGWTLKSLQRWLTSRRKIPEEKEGLIHSLEEEEILLNLFLKGLSGELKLIQEESNLVQAMVLKRQCDWFGGVVKIQIPGPLPQRFWCRKATMGNH